MKFLSNINKIIRRKFIYRFDYTGERVIPTEMHGDVKTWIQHLSRYVFALDYVVNKATLDVACGSGYGLSILSSVAKCVTGIDVNEDAICWAKNNNKFYCPIDFIIKNVDTGTMSGKFDSVISFETIEHLKDPKKFLRGVAAIINWDGVFVFSVPLEDPPNKFHKQRFNWKSLKKLIEHTLGNNVRWYSQIDHNISDGQMSAAKFGLGIWFKK